MIADLIALFHDATPAAHAQALTSSLITAALGALAIFGWWIGGTGQDGPGRAE